MTGLTRPSTMVALYLLFLSLAAAVPWHSPVKTRAEFSAAVGSSYQRHGHLDARVEYLRTLRKFNLPVPDQLQKVVSRVTAAARAKKAEEAARAARAHRKEATNDGSTVPAISEEGDLYWITPVGIGSPPQQMYMDFDTGSADTWVFSTDTKAEEVSGQVLWDPSKSTSASLVPNATWDIIYGDFSSSSGIVYKDTFSLGSMSIPNMTIESAQSVSDQFTEEPRLSGLVGLAFGTLAQSVPRQNVLLDYLPAALKQPLFTCDLRHNSSHGSFNFGYIDDSLHGADIEYVKVDDTDGFWGVQMTGFAVAGENMRYEFMQPQTVVVDTGSTLFYGPDDAVQQYFASVPGGNFSYEEYGYVLPCNGTAPDFIWEIGDASGARVIGRVPGNYLPYQVLNEQGMPSGMCYAGLQSLGSVSEPKGILGDVWLKSAFQVFDVAKMRLGSAPKILDGDLHRVEKPDGHYKRGKENYWNKKKRML